jgi:uncharacterized protein YciI
MGTAGGYVKYFVLIYDVVGDFAARRAEFRQEHLRLVRVAHDRGDLPLAGALGDPPDAALLVFHAPSISVAEDFARNDPYVTNGLVTRWQVRPWNVVTLGDFTARTQQV